VSDGFSKGFPVIDKFNFSTGVATSIKSIDIFAKSYNNNMSQLASTLNRYVSSLANFSGGTRNGIQVNWFDIRQRVLEVVLPAGRISMQQAETLKKVQESAAQQGVRVVYVQAQ
jgi:hypothetical protein